MTLDRAAQLQLLSQASGLELASYRMRHVDECIRRASAQESVADVSELARRLRSDSGAHLRFRRLVAVSVSGLFRDPAQFDLLERELLPQLLDDGRRLAVWSAGCANGSELYSVAILLERMEALEQAFLLGSDLLRENLAEARRGVYGSVTISTALRARVRWEQRDLVRDGAPGGGFRLVLCRNVAIYLTEAAKALLHERLVSALALGGVLLLGRSERLADPAALRLDRIAPQAYRRIA